jgi:hypothetical protein
LGRKVGKSFLKSLTCSKISPWGGDLGIFVWLCFCIFTPHHSHRLMR